MTTKIGVIGFAGKQGQEYLTALSCMDSIAVCGGVDSSLAAGSIAARYDFPVFASVEELIRHCAMDACLVAVPHYLHARVTKKLLEARVPVLKEKPLAINGLEARMLLKTAEQTGTPVITLTQRAFRPDFVFARQRLAELGEPVWFCYEYHTNMASPTAGWRARRELAAGGVLLDMGYHAIDVLTTWLGEMFVVAGDMHYVYASSRDEMLEDIASIQLDLVEKGCTGNLHVLRHSDRKHENFEVHCSGGTVRVSARDSMVTVTQRGSEAEETRHFNLDKLALSQSILSGALQMAGRRDAWHAHMRRHAVNVRLCEQIYQESTQHLWRTPHIEQEKCSIYGPG